MNFFDKLNRLHTKPTTIDDDFPTNNAYIYSAYYKVLYPDKNYTCYLPKTMPFSRHPTVKSVSISHDEVTGVCILSKEKAKEICAFLDKNYNQFCDLPGFVPVPFYKLNLFKVIKAFRALSKEENPRRATVNYPIIHNIAYWQKPEYRWVYKKAAGLTPTLFEKAWFLVARAVTVFRWTREDPDILLYFSLKYLEQQNNLGIEGRIIQMYMKTYTDDMYVNDKDMLKYATRDLPAEYYSIHPYITN